MPFSHVTHVYQPEQLAKLATAFNQAWPQISSARQSGTSAHMEWLRSRLADYLLACANAGVFDPDELTEKAVRAFISPTAEPEAQSNA